MERPKASSVAIGIVLFLFFVLITFPFGNLRGVIFGKIYKATGVTLVADEIYPSFFGWPGIGIKNADVTFPLADGELELSCKKLIVRVGVGSLFPPAPSISMKLVGLKKGGDLYVKFSQAKDQINTRFDADSVNLHQFTVPGLPEPFSGILSASGSIHFDSEDPAKSNGKISLDAEKFRVPAQNMQGFIFPAMSIGSVKGLLNIRNGIAEITKLELGTKDSDLGGNASGEIRLAKNFLSTFLNITLRLTLSNRYRQNPQSETLVSLLNTFKTAKAGEYAMRWNITLMDMRTNPLSAIPQAVP